MLGRDFQPTQCSSQEPATTYTHEQCQSIMSPILAQGLPSARFVRTFPHVLAHGLLKFCGANIPNLFTEQTLAHIHTLLKYSNLPQDLMGFLLRASGEVMQLKLGLTGQLFEVLLILQEVVMDSWLKHTWLAMCQANIHLMVDISDFPLNKQGDKELVWAFLQHGVNKPNLEPSTDVGCFYMSYSSPTYALHWGLAVNNKLVQLQTTLLGLHMAKNVTD